MAVLRLEDVCYRDILKNISFHIGENESVGLIGPSGSGKTMVAHAIMRFIKPVSGAVYFNDIDLLSLNEAEMRSYRGNRIGYIFQDPLSSLNPTMKIGKQLAEALGATNKEAIATLMRSVGLDPVTMNAYPFQYSGGMKQRVVIAMAIARKPALLIADEPTTALDAITQMHILNLLRHLIADYRMSLLLISHDPAVIRHLCSRSVYIKQGESIRPEVFYATA